MFSLPSGEYLLYAFAFGLGCMNSLHAKIVYDKAPIDGIVLIYD